MDDKNLRPQHSVAQGSYCLDCPRHFDPSGQGSSTHCLVLFMSPKPHVTEQALQSVHGPHSGGSVTLISF